MQNEKVTIIINTTNYGFLYSRSIGIIHSSKEYFINLDSDYQLYDYDYFLIFKS